MEVSETDEKLLLKRYEAQLVDDGPRAFLWLAPRDPFVLQNNYTTGGIKKLCDVLVDLEFVFADEVEDAWRAGSKVRLSAVAAQGCRRADAWFRERLSPGAASIDWRTHDR